MATKVSINQFQCSICLNEFIQPKLIDCHHSFCLGCLEDYVSRFTTNGRFPCPLCRRNIQVPTSGVKEFSSNFYIDQTGSVGKMYCVNHDEEKLIELYCKQCFQAICLKCYITKHNGHEVLDLESETTKGSVKEDQTEVSKQLKEKIKTYDDQLEMLRFITLRLDLITKTSREKVEQKVEELCEEIKNQGDDLLVEISKVDDAERGAINETIDEVQEKKKDMESYVQLLANSSNLQSLVEVLDTLPKAKALLADESSTDTNLPKIRFPIFITNQEELDVTGDQLGRNITSPLNMFKSSFDFESLKDEEEHCAVVNNYNLEPLSMCLVAKKEKEKLGLYLKFSENDNENENDSENDSENDNENENDSEHDSENDNENENDSENDDLSENNLFVTILVTIKLVNYTDSSKSKLMEANFNIKLDAMICGWKSFMDWDKLVDPENGFIDDKKEFQVETSAIFTDFKIKE